MLSTDQTCQEIIRKHRSYLGDPIATLEVTSTTLGIMSDTHIQKHVHLFVAYAIWLQRTTQTLEAELCASANLTRDRPQEPKAPFQVIPQLTLKVRFINFGKEQMVELIQLLIDEPEVQALFSYDEIPSIDDRVAANVDKAELKVQELLVVCARLDEIVDKTKTKTKTKTETQRAGERVARTRLVKAKQTLVKLQAIQERPRKRQKTLSITETEKWAAVPDDAWRKMIDRVSRTLFAVPSHLQQKWTGTVSTNGVVAHWHLKREQQPHAKGPPKTVKPIKTAPTPVRQLQNRHYGVHQQDSEFSALRHLNIVAVDPGAVDLISAVRLHNTEEALRQLAAPLVEFTDETYKQRRRRLLNKRMFELKRSIFTLSEQQKITG